MKKIIFLALLFSCVPQMKSNISQQVIQKTDCVEAQKAEFVNQIEFEYGSQLATAALKSSTYTLDGYTYDSKYETDHFLFYYDSSQTSYNITTEAGNVFETVRTKYVNMGFRNPILEKGQSKYRVGLSTDTTTGNLGVTTYWLGNKTSASHITMYCLANSITNTFKETAAHEYLHAIQDAYNINMNWFAEASAGWGEFAVWGTSYTTPYDIAHFINNNPSLTDDNYHYGSAIFPLTLSEKCSNRTIVRVFEGFANMDGEYTDQKFVNIVNNALSQSSSSLRFPQILNAMHSYMVKPSKWYWSYGANKPEVNWSYTSPSQYINITTTNFEGSVSGSIANLTGKYIKFNIGSGIKGNINYSIIFNNSNGISSKYLTSTITNSDEIYPCSSGSLSSSISNYGIDYSGAGLVLTNPNINQSISYTIYYSVSPKTVKTGQTSYLYFEPEDLNYYYGYYAEYVEWYELQSSLSIGNVPSECWGTVKITGYESDADFYSDSIYFDVESGRFNFSFYTHDPNASGSVRITFTYIQNVPIRVTTRTCYTSYYYFMPNSFEFFSGHGQDWYTLEFTMPVSGVPQEAIDTIQENGFQAQTYISFYNSSIYYDSYDGLLHCTLYSRNAGYGIVRLSYTYQIRTIPTV